jgi:hypothetical protein
MASNILNGRCFGWRKYPSNEVNLTPAEPRLTIATVLFCLVGPFWLSYRLIKYLLKTSGLVPDRIERATE